MKFFVINFFVLLFLTTGVNASTNSNGNNKFITKDIFVESLNLETFDNFLTSIESFETPKSNFFKIPNENNINKIKSQFLFTNRFNTLDLLLRFKMVSAEQPEYLFEIYQVALSKIKNLNYIKDDPKNLLGSNNEILTVYFVEELMNILGLVQQTETRAELDSKDDVLVTCMDDEDCPPHSPGAEYTKMLSLAGATYGLTLSDYGPIYAGTTNTYDAALAATWAAREEFDMVNAARVEANQSSMGYSWTGGLLDIVSGNPYEQLGVHHAYGYGLSGAGVMVAVTDDGLCYDANDTDQVHQDLKGSGKVTTFGDFTEAVGSGDGIHGCHVATTVLGNYDNNSNSSAMQTEIAGHFNSANGDISSFDPSYSTMGIAYNSTLHFSDFGLNQANQELAIEDATAKGAKVWTNSWGWTGDRTTTDVIAQSGSNNYAKYANWRNSLGGTSWTETTVTNYIDAINQFQETGVVLWAISNTRASQSTVYGGASNQVDMMAAYPTLFPQLSEAFLAVGNTFTLSGGSRILNSSPCGEAAAWCVVHDGYNITQGGLALEGSNDGSWYTTMTGSSMATPQVAGAVALLWEAFPDNTPELITKRLLLTANNSWLTENQCLEDTNSDGLYTSGDSITASCGGITGTLTYNGISHDYNDTYGHGNPDVYAALQPIGKKNLIDNTDRAYPVLGSVLLASTVFGNTMSFADEQAYYRDQLDGGFKLNVSNLVGVHQSRDTLNQRLFSNGDHIWSGTFNDQGLNFATSVQNDLDQNQLSDDHKFYMSFNAGGQSVFVGQKYSVEQMLGLQNGNTTASILNRSTGNNSVLSLTEASANGQVIGSEIDLNNKLSFSVAAYNGEHEVTDLNEKGFLANFKYRIQNNSASFFFGQNIESDSILRSSGSGAFGSFAGKTYHAGVSFDKKIASNLYMSGLFDYGVVTDASADGLFLSDMSNLETFEFNLGFVIPNMFSNKDFATFKISQPLRTERGFSKLNLPGLRDTNGKVTMISKNIDLEPSGRELNLDAGYEKVINSKSSYKLGTQLSIAPNHSNNNNEHMIYGTYSIAF
ncbi:S8 family serine peptidase [Pelagibacterales bacterium]|nr:S8 family serine peptidase [Pelagibacterales bacterium]